MRVRLVVALLAVTRFAAPNSGAAPAERAAPPVVPPPIVRAEPLAVRFYDPYRLLSHGVEEWIRREVMLVFERSGIGIRFVDRGGREVIPATLYPELPDRWKVPEAIGVAIGAHGERRSVFLSLGAAERALGLRRGRRTEWDGKRRGTKRRSTGRESRRLGIALGRVLAHELTHTIAPDCPHTASGLMAERLSRRLLTAPGVRFDALATRHLRRAAGGLGMSAPESG